MLLGEECDRSAFAKLDDATGCESWISHRGPEPFKASSSARITLHVVAEESQQRAAMSRLIVSAGHHAQVYSSNAELVGDRPTSGVVLVHDFGALCTAQACNALSNAGLWLPVIGFGEDISPSRIVAGMKAGAMDYLVGEICPEALLAKILQWGTEAEAVSSIQKRRAMARAALGKLTIREREVLDLLVTGEANKGIARKLEISPRTVEIHRMRVLAKLGATSAAHAVSIRLDALDA